MAENKERLYFFDHMKRTKKKCIQENRGAGKNILLLGAESLK